MAEHKQKKTGEHFEWPTPQDLVKQIELKYGKFDLDPCATDENHKAARYFTIIEDGLLQDWSSAKRVFMNPPYGPGLDKWVNKAVTTAQQGTEVVCLLPVRTDVGWFHDWVLVYGEVTFIRGRVKFNGGAGGNPPFTSMIVRFPAWEDPYRFNLQQVMFGMAQPARTGN